MTEFNATRPGARKLARRNVFGRALGALLLAGLPLSLMAIEGTADSFDQSAYEVIIGGELASGASPGSDLWGDDTIGALPVYGDSGSDFSGTGFFPLLNAIMGSAAPSMYLEGSIADLRRMIVDAEGTATSFAYIEPTRPGHGRLLIQGAARISIHRGLFTSNRVKVGMFAGLDHGRSRVAFQSIAGVSGSMQLVGGSLANVNLNKALKLGLIGPNPLTANVYTPAKLANGRLSFSADTSFITLHQMQ